MGPDPASDDRLATHSLDPASARPATESGYLLVLDGTTSRRLGLPRHGVLLVGRGGEADIVIDSQAVSRRHAEIMVADGLARLVDLDSHNGTLLNGEPLTGARSLASGDAIRIGEVEILYRRAARRGDERPLLDPPSLARRLDEEIERMRASERPLGVVALIIEGGLRAVEATALAPALARCLHRLDTAGRAADGGLVALLPERERDAAAEIATRLVATLSRGAAVRAGFAVAPADGSDGLSLLAAARAAALGAAPGEARDAAASSIDLVLGDRVATVADPAMVRLYELIRRLAASELPVLIAGETGVGKENAAWAVHWYSKRAGGPFVALNCAAFTESLVESELFGHQRGAFSGATATKPGRIETASGGTLFLDEVGELSAGVQAKLLRVLETQRITRVGGLEEIAVDLRVVAATNRDLEAEVAAGRFRRDLLFRLRAATVVLPPLRDRPREIALLAQRFLEAACQRLGRSPLALSTATLLVLAQWPWPGNVRELRNLMDFLAATVTDEVGEPWHLPEAMVPGDPAEVASPEVAVAAAALAAPGAARRTFRPLGEEVREFERRLLLEALAACGGVRVRAAELIGLPLRTFKYKLKQHGITGGVEPPSSVER